MDSKFLLDDLILTLFHQSHPASGCRKDWNFDGNFACGEGCTRTPECVRITCDNVDNMCYFDCKSDSGLYGSKLGYKWNGGKLKKDQTGKMGDGRAYKG